MPAPQDNWLLTINGVGCNIYTGPDGQDGHLSEDNASDAGRRAKVRFKCAWSDRNKLIAGLVGTVDYRQTTIVRTPPFSYPTAPPDDFNNGGPIRADSMFGTSITDVSGIKWSTDIDGSETGLQGWGAFTYALVDCEFSSPPYLITPVNGVGDDLVHQTYCITKLRVNGEVFSPPSGAYQWAEGGFINQPVNDANVGLMRAKYELSVTRVRMPIVPMETLDAMISTVNKVAIKVGTNTITPEAALFLGYNPEPYKDPASGQIVYNIEMLWAINGLVTSRNADGSWNWFVDPSGDWSAIVSTGKANSAPPFSAIDHNNLFADNIT